MPGLPPRSHARDRDLAAKPTPVARTNQGYLMMEKTALGSRYNCAAQAWPNQTTGVALPNASSRKESKAQVSFPRPVIDHRTHRDSAKHGTGRIPSGYTGSRSEIQPRINTHRPRHTPAA